MVMFEWLVLVAIIAATVIWFHCLWQLHLKLREEEQALRRVEKLLELMRGPREP